MWEVCIVSRYSLELLKQNSLGCFYTGIDSGSRLRVRGEGNAGKAGGPTGDLYVFINVRPYPKLNRDGTTIYTSIEISYVEAILGTTVNVPTVDGDVDLKVPAGCQPETTLLMAKRGVPNLNSPSMRGDQKVSCIAKRTPQLK